MTTVALHYLPAAVRIPFTFGPVAGPDYLKGYLNVVGVATPAAVEAHFGQVDCLIMGVRVNQIKYVGGDTASPDWKRTHLNSQVTVQLLTLSSIETIQAWAARSHSVYSLTRENPDQLEITCLFTTPGMQCSKRIYLDARATVGQLRHSLDLTSATGDFFSTGSCRIDTLVIDPVDGSGTYTLLSGDELLRHHLGLPLRVNITVTASAPVVYRPAYGVADSCRFIASFARNVRMAIADGEDRRILREALLKEMAILQTILDTELRPDY